MCAFRGGSKVIRKLILLVLAIMLTATGFAGSMGYYGPGDKVDDFALKLAGGGEFVLSEYKGKIVVLNLWASWCSDCVDYSIPALAELSGMYPDDVAVVAINCGDAAGDVEDFAAGFAGGCPVAIDEDLDIMYDYFPTSSIPYTVFIDRDGRFFASCESNDDGACEEYAQIISEMMAEE